MEMVTEREFFSKKDELRVDLHDVAKRDGFKNQIRKFIRSGFEDFFIRVDDELKGVIKQAGEVSDEYFKLRLEEAELEERLDAVKKNLAGRDFGVEFEKIMGMENVGTVRVEKRYNKRGVLVINLKRIFQLDSSDYEKKYELGEFEIEIDPFLKNYLGIHFYQERKRGPYKHAHAAEGNTCFGNSDEGLNNAIKSLMLGFNVIPLVHLLLSFLVKEISKPFAATVPSALGLEYDTNNYEPSPDNFYASHEDRELAKKEFVEFLKEVAFHNLSNVTLNRLGETRNKIKQLLEQRQSYYNLIKEIECQLDFCEQKMISVDDVASEETDRLLNDHDVFWLGAEEDTVAIFFELPVSAADFSGETLRLLEEVLGYILIIRHDRPVEILFLKSQRIGDDKKEAEVSSLKILELKDIHDPKEDFESKIAEFQKKAMICDLLSLIKDLIFNFWTMKKKEGEDERSDEDGWETVIR